MALATWKAALTTSVMLNSFSGSSVGGSHIGLYVSLLFLKNCNMFPCGQYSMITQISQYRPRKTQLVKHIRTSKKEMFGHWKNTESKDLALWEILLDRKFLQLKSNPTESGLHSFERSSLVNAIESVLLFPISCPSDTWVTSLSDYILFEQRFLPFVHAASKLTMFLCDPMCINILSSDIKSLRSDSSARSV